MTEREIIARIKECLEAIGYLLNELRNIRPDAMSVTLSTRIDATGRQVRRQVSVAARVIHPRCAALERELGLTDPEQGR